MSEELVASWHGGIQVLKWVLDSLRVVLLVHAAQSSPLQVVPQLVIPLKAALNTRQMAKTRVTS